MPIAVFTARRLTVHDVGAAFHSKKPGDAEGSICLINLAFEPSYWGFECALPLYPGDKQCTTIFGVTGTSVQKGQIREIRLELRERRLFTVVGGP